MVSFFFFLRRATEAEHRQRVFEKQRELEAKKKQQQRGEAKRRREQVCAPYILSRRYKTFS